MYVYDPVRFSTYKDRWTLAADSTIAHLASHPSSRPDLTYLAAYNSKTLSLGSGHLACFDGGNFILGGLVLKEQKYVDFGLELVASCENTYNQTLTGIGPEGFGWDEGRVPSDQKEFYERAGFYITSANYVLRPEVLESFYYAYRATGDRKYQDVSWNPSSLFSRSIDRIISANERTVVLRRLPSHRQHHARRQRLQLDHRRQCGQRR
jgi:mannosyl-oligosaccharide alpha-1,2-mannosidase